MLASSSIFHVLFRRMPPPDLGQAPTYADVDSRAYRRTEVRFPSGEHMLFSCWFPAANACGTVLIAHGLGSSAEAHLPETLFFLNHGFSVFSYDATGMGKSEGRSMVGMSQSRQDVISAVRYLRKSDPQGPLFLYGHSMGGYGVLSALPEIDANAAVCINGFRKPVALMYRCARRYVGLLADMAYPFLCLQNRFTFGKGGNADALLAAKQAQIPVLILNGKEDRLIPRKVKLTAKDSQTEDILFRTVDGGHTGIWLAEDGKHVNEPLMEIILGFFLSAQ